MKLSSLTIILSALFLSIAVFLAFFFTQYMPNQKEIGMLDTNTQELIDAGNKLDAAKKRQKNAIDMVNTSAAAWQSIVATKTPPASLKQGGVDLNVNAYQLLIDTKTYRDSLQTELNAQLKKGGVEVVNGPLVPLVDQTQPANGILASFYNYGPIKFPVVVFDLGQVTVRGTYEQITANVRAWKDMPRYLAVADGLAISGTSPHLTGTYNLTIVGYIRSKQIFPAVAEVAASGNAGGAGGGGMRGGGGAVPGGPGPIPGGPGPLPGGAGRGAAGGGMAPSLDGASAGGK